MHIYHKHTEARRNLEFHSSCALKPEDFWKRFHTVLEIYRFTDGWSHSPKILPGLNLPPKIGITMVCHYRWLLGMNSDDWIQVFIFIRQTFYQMSFLRRPSKAILKSLQLHEYFVQVTISWQQCSLRIFF